MTPPLIRVIKKDVFFRQTSLNVIGGKKGKSSFGVFFFGNSLKLKDSRVPLRRIWKMKKKCNHITMDDLRKAISGDILKATVEKSQTNEVSVAMKHLRKAIWGDIWKRTLEKSETNATNVTIHHLRQAIWGLECRGKKQQQNVTNATLHPFKQTIWVHT